MKAKNIVIAILTVALIGSAAGNVYFWQESRAAGHEYSKNIELLQGELTDAKAEQESLRQALDATMPERDIQELENKVIHNGIIGQEWRQLYYELLDAVQPSNATEWRIKAMLITGDPDVWAEPGSTYYHRESCPRLGSVSVTIKLSYAHEQSMSPCPDCEPIVWAAWD